MTGIRRRTRDAARYYVGRRLAGQRVAVAVAAAARVLVIRHHEAVVIRAPLHGLLPTRLPFERYVELMGEQARATSRPVGHDGAEPLPVYGSRTSTPPWFTHIVAGPCPG